MRAREAQLGKGLSSQNVCVLRMGLLPISQVREIEVVGIIKTIHIPYLSQRHFSVVGVCCQDSELHCLR